MFLLISKEADWIYYDWICIENKGAVNMNKNSELMWNVINKKVQFVQFYK